jgi:hypothetical protein
MALVRFLDLSSARLAVSLDECAEIASALEDLLTAGIDHQDVRVVLPDLGAATSAAREELNVVVRHVLVLLPC